MRRFGLLGKFLVGGGCALIAWLVLLGQGGFDESVTTDERIAIVVGMVILGGVVMVGRASAREKAFTLGRRMRETKERKREKDAHQ